VSKEVKDYKIAHPNAKVVSLGIGDVSFPICEHVKNKMKEACDNQASANYVGYGNYYGLLELRQAIKENEYPDFSVDEIYVSDGTKTDSIDILEMFDVNARIAIYAPLYPIYVNGSYCVNRKFETKDQKDILKEHFDIVYLCNPNNPTGYAFTYDELKVWVDYALKNNAVIIYDNVYFKFINSPNTVKSIYEIAGSKKCAIELRSFSKHVSFTGIRCSYYVIPNELYPNINEYWKLRTLNRFNGASYIAQIGALASFDAPAQKVINKNITYYLKNAHYLRENFIKMGYEVIGGTDAPYLWIKCKEMNSWETFRYFLKELNVVVIPGSIFSLDGYFRVSSLGKYEDIVLAIERIMRYEESK